MELTEEMRTALERVPDEWSPQLDANPDLIVYFWERNLVMLMKIGLLDQYLVRRTKVGREALGRRGT